MSRKKSKKQTNTHGRQITPPRCGTKGAYRILEGLYLSGEHFAQGAGRMQSLGIASIVACGCQAHFHDIFRYKEIHLRDAASSDVYAHLEPAADFVARSLEDGAVLVHCKAGICRSATMVAAYLIKYQQELAPTVDEAVAVIRAARHCANPRPEFRAALQKFSDQLLLRKERDNAQKETTTASTF